MSTPLETQIDELYKGSLDSFTASRNALAKTLAGPSAARVKQLAKPAVVPWAVNQVYWHERAVFDRVRRSGEKLRTVQLAALKSGKSARGLGRPGKGEKAEADAVRAATEAHRRALADAVAAASKLAAAAGASPGTDELMRTFEALSLAAEVPAPPGRLTRPLQPAGFEALAGVAIAARPDPDPTPAAAPPRAARATASKDAKDAAAAREHAREEAAAARRQEQAITAAKATLQRAQEHEHRARDAWDRAKRDLDAAEQALAALRQA